MEAASCIWYLKLHTTSTGLVGQNRMIPRETLFDPNLYLSESTVALTFPALGTGSTPSTNLSRSIQCELDMKLCGSIDHDNSTDGMYRSHTKK